MKNKILALLVMLVVIAVISACGAAPQSGSAPVAETAPAQVAEPVVEKIIETVVVEVEKEVEKIVTATPETGVLAEVSPEDRAWLEAAQIGPFQPETEDWDAVYEAAKQEGKVMVYSHSSRLFDVGEEFQKLYPGVTVEPFDMEDADILLKIKGEQGADIYNADVFIMGDAPSVLNELVEPHLVWNFVPKELDAVLRDQDKDPILIHHYGMKVLAYNSEVYQESPMDSWWDLTREEWKGKVIMEDPLDSGDTLNLFNMMVKNADKMAEAYEAEFGKPIELDEDAPTAAHQWIKDLIKNEPVLTGSSDDVSAGIGTFGQVDPPVGFVSYSKYRDVLKGEIAFEPVIDAKPITGEAHWSSLGILNRAPHPNAAKLLINYMMTEEGYDPWMVPGDLPTRTDFPAPEGAFGMDVAEEILWRVDPEYAYLYLPEIRDYWIIKLEGD